jgi:hypothetical protein
MKNIMISGADGTGKSTIVKSVMNHYAKGNILVAPVWLRFNHYLTKVVNLIGRLTGKSFYEQYPWGKIGYHNYKDLIGYFYIIAIFIDHLIFRIFMRHFVLKTQKNSIYMIDRYILDIVADLIVDTGKIDFVFRLFDGFIKKELKLANTFILVCPKDIVISRRADILDDKKYDDKIFAYNLIAQKYKITKLNTGKYSIDEIVSKIVIA